MSLIQAPPAATGQFILLCGALGCAAGVGLNALIDWLPARLQRDWRLECYDYLQLPPPATADEAPPSRAPGRRYPVVIFLAALGSAAAAWRFGQSPAALAALIYTWALLALAFIDSERQLLPDHLTMPMLWLGLLLSLFHLFADSRDAIIGAAAGYLSLWSVYKTFLALTGKEGMGYGDFKLLAMCGAWLGWAYLPQIIFLASLGGGLAGLALIWRNQLAPGQAMPFGPYLAAAGWLAMFCGDRLNEYYFDWVGL